MAVATLAALGLAAALPQAAQAQTTVNYMALGTFTQTTAAPIDTGGVTANAGTGLFSNSSSQGLGVQGGVTPFGFQVIDGTESVLFTFDAGPATGVSYLTGAATQSNGNLVSLTGYGTGGASLGSVQINPLSSPNVSALFGNAPLSGFRFTGGAQTGASILRLTFTPGAATVPEPSSVAAFAFTGLGAAGLILKARRHKRLTA